MANQLQITVNGRRHDATGARLRRVPLTAERMKAAMDAVTRS